MEDGALFGNVVPEDIENVVSCFTVVHDYGKVVAARNLQMLQEKLYLSILVLAVLAVVQTGLAYGHDAVEAQKLLKLCLPTLDIVSALCRRNTYCMEDVLGTLEVVVYLFEVNQAVAD